MNKLKINTFLICATVGTTPKQWEEIYDFLHFKKQTIIGNLLCITTHEKYFVMSKPKPDIVVTHARLHAVLSFKYKEDGVLLISDLPLEDLLDPIIGDILFGDQELMTLEGKSNENYVDELKLLLRSNPNTIIYDAHTMRFTK